MECLQRLLDSELEQMAVIRLMDGKAMEEVRFSERLSCKGEVGLKELSPARREQVKERASRGLAGVEKEGVQSAEMEELLGEMLGASLQRLGLFEGGRRRLADLQLGRAAAGFYERWLERSLEYLQQQGWLGNNGENGKDSKDGKEGKEGKDVGMSAEVRGLEQVWREWEEKKREWARDANLQAQIRLLEACLRGLPEILRGERLATDVMFPNASMELVEGIYGGNALADYFNEVVGEVLGAWLEQQREGKEGKEGNERDEENEENKENKEKHKEKKIRILEIGAGTGGTTVKLLPLLKHYGVEEYCYTDLSRAFLIHGEEQYGRELA